MSLVGGSRDDVIATTDFQLIQDFLQRSCGLVVNDGKQYLVKSRLTPLLPRFNLNSFSDLAQRLKAPDASGYALKDAVIDAMTTNETYWFRDESQFNELRSQILPEFYKANAFSLDVWSAACSSGQEPYSISMCFEDLPATRRVQIVATDISNTMLKAAERGVYCDLEMARGLTEDQKVRYFEKTAEGFQVKSSVRQRVRFRNLNLMDSFASMGQFDLIFCRNVLIYFAELDKQDILQRMVSSLKPGGLLFLSSTEAMPASMKSMQRINGVYATYFQKIQ